LTAARGKDQLANGRAGKPPPKSRYLPVDDFTRQHNLRNLPIFQPIDDAFLLVDHVDVIRDFTELAF
jgi:hypothetical protein